MSIPEYILAFALFGVILTVLAWTRLRGRLT